MLVSDVDFTDVLLTCCDVVVVQLEKVEKERMKRVVLNIHERQEEEDYQGCY